MMKQELLWRVLPNQNLGLLDFIGQDYNYETKKAITQYVFAEHFRLCRFKNPVGSISFVYQVDPKTNKILNIGAGVVLENKETLERRSDLVLDNLGILFGQMNKLANTGGSGNIQITKTNGALGNTHNGFTPASNTTNGEFFVQNTFRPIGWTVDLGSGNTPPTRQDFNIEASLNDTPAVSILGGYDAILSQVLWSAQTVVVTGGENVRECCSFKSYNYLTGTQSSETAMRTRDLVSPEFVTITGKTIFIDIIFNI